MTTRVLTRRRCSKCGGWDYYEDDHGWQTHCINCGHIGLLERPVQFRQGVIYEADKTQEPHNSRVPHSRPRYSTDNNPGWDNSIMVLEH
jgi:hypothetical protein